MRSAPAGMLRSAWFSTSTWCSARARNSSSAEILEAGIARHRQVRAIQLQHKSALGDGLVLGAHGGPDRLDILLVRWIEEIGWNADTTPAMRRS